MASTNRLGGPGKEKPADHSIQTICDSVKDKFLEETGMNTKEFTAVSYTQQVVAGMIYCVKIRVAEDKYCHLKIYKPLPQTGGKPELQGHQCDKTKGDPIECF